MRKSKDIKDLMSGWQRRLTDLKNPALERSKVLEHVRAALPGSGEVRRQRRNRGWDPRSG